MTTLFHSRFAVTGLLIGALACSSNSARTDEAGAAPRDSTALDTAATSTSPSSYSGTERDTTGGAVQQAPVDTFLQQQGTNPAVDTAGYSGIERNDSSGTSAQPGNVQDQGQNPTPGQTQPAPSGSTALPSDSGVIPADSSGVNNSGAAQDQNGNSGFDSTSGGAIDSTSGGAIDSTGTGSTGTDTADSTSTDTIDSSSQQR